MGVNYTPEPNPYLEMNPFRFWCQKVLPLAYDDALSYYEVLCKLSEYLNEMLSNVESLKGDVDNLRKAFEALQEWVNNYFENLDIKGDIKETIIEMVNDGTLTEILKPYIDQEILNKWNAEYKKYVDQQDASILSQANAHSDAADAEQKKYVDQQDASILSQANAHSDAADAEQNTNISKNASDITNLSNRLNGLLDNIAERVTVFMTRVSTNTTLAVTTLPSGDIQANFKGSITYTTAPPLMEFYTTGTFKQSLATSKPNTGYTKYLCIKMTNRTLSWVNNEDTSERLDTTQYRPIVRVNPAGNVFEVYASGYGNWITGNIQA